MRCRAVAGGLARSLVGTCAKVEETSSTASISATNRGINGVSPCLTSVQLCAVSINVSAAGRREACYIDLVPLLLLILLLPVLVIAFMPVILIQRYRVGTARRLARPWVASLGAVAMVFSGVLFLVAAAVTTHWVPGALRFATAGIGGGCGLGVIGLGLTRWEPTPRSLHYTPNRWLVLAITLLVTARVLYGLWRTWSVAYVSVSDASFVTAFGVRETLAAGGIVLGYYLAYSAGLRWQIRRWQRRRLRMM